MCNVLKLFSDIQYNSTCTMDCPRKVKQEQEDKILRLSPKYFDKIPDNCKCRTNNIKNRPLQIIRLKRPRPTDIKI